MSYNWNKFTHLFNEEGPTKAEIKAANKAVHTMEDPEYSPGSHLEKYKKAANRRARLPKPKKAGTPEEIKKAIAQHKKDIYAAGEKSKGKLDDWTAYQTIGHIIAEVFGLTESDKLTKSSAPTPGVTPVGISREDLAALQASSKPPKPKTRDRSYTARVRARNADDSRNLASKNK